MYNSLLYRKQALVSQIPLENDSLCGRLGGLLLSLWQAWGVSCSLAVSCHPSQPALLLQIGDEARWLGGAPPRGSCVVFITSARSECRVSKCLFLFGSRWSSTPSLPPAVFPTWWGGRAAWLSCFPDSGPQAQEGNRSCK